MTEPAPCTQCGTPADLNGLAEAIADLVAVKLASSPTLLDAIAAQASSHGKRSSASTDEHTQDGSNNAEDLADEAAAEEAQNLQSWTMRNHPELVSGDSAVWSRAVVAAAGPDASLPMLKWAMSPTNPTDYWRTLDGPLSIPKAGRRNHQNARNPLGQMVSEYRIANNQPDAPAQIDQLVSGIRERIEHFGVRSFEQRPTMSRQAAVKLLARNDWDARAVVEIIGWAMETRPHWRSNVSGVPTENTYKKIRGDWVASGNGAIAAVPAAEQEQIDVLAKGWVYHFSRRQGWGSMPVTDRTRRNLHDCLVGADGADPIPIETLKNFVRWLCEHDNRHTGFMVTGVHFPALASVRRGITSMNTTCSGTSVASTNSSAAGTVASTIDVTEV